IRTRSRSARATLDASAALRPRTFTGASMMFSSTVMCGNRLNDWKTMPTRVRRAGRLTPGLVSDSPSTTSSPPWMGSSAFTQRMLPGAICTGARSPEAVPFVLGQLPVIPVHPEQLLVRDYSPVCRSVEDIRHSVDDTNVTATLDDFRKIEMRVGRIVAVDDFPEARNPSYKLAIDFGPHGTRKS